MGCYGGPIVDPFDMVEYHSNTFQIFIWTHTGQDVNTIALTCDGHLEKTSLMTMHRHSRKHDLVDEIVSATTFQFQGR